MFLNVCYVLFNIDKWHLDKLFCLSVCLSVRHIFGCQITIITKVVNSAQNPFLDLVTHFIPCILMYDYIVDDLKSLEYINKDLLYFRGKSYRPRKFKLDNTIADCIRSTSTSNATRRRLHSISMKEWCGRYSTTRNVLSIIRYDTVSTDKSHSICR